MRRRRLLTALLVGCLGCADPIQITLVTKLLDPLMLAAMALLPAGEEHRNGLVLLHVLRFGVANSSRPQLRSLMMDHVDKASETMPSPPPLADGTLRALSLTPLSFVGAPQKHRGKWNAVDSIRTVSWSGSAMLGGYGRAYLLDPQGTITSRALCVLCCV